MCNDDGVGAPGLQAMVEALSGLGEIWVVAPDRDRSGTGHAITVHQPVEVRETRLPGAERAFTVQGTPADCVKLAVLELMGQAPDLVAAGINAGSNLGIDVIYSGTVAAAAEGALLRARAIAVSAVTDKSNPRLAAAQAVARFLAEWVLTGGLLPGVFLNVNVPDRALQPLEQLTWTRLGLNRRYRDEYVRLPAQEGRDENGRYLFWLTGDADDGDLHDPSTDAGAVHRGRVSVTPVHLDLTDHQALARWAAAPGTLWLRGFRAAWDARALG